MNWHVGQKVVCVDNVCVEEFLTNGHVYDVHEVRWCCNDKPTLGVGIMASMPCFCTQCLRPYPSMMIGFGSTRFRPLDELDRIQEEVETEGIPIEEPAELVEA